MPKLLSDYFVPVVEETSENEILVKVIYDIAEIDKNPYRHPEEKATKDFVLSISTRHRCVPDEGNGVPRWYKGGASGGDHPLKFYISYDTTPTLEEFSQHIYKECRAAFLAFKYKPWQTSYVRGDRDDLEPNDVWRFLKNLGFSTRYFRTEKFLEHYDYWHDRLYSSQKWLHYLSGELEWYGADVEIGPKIYEFLDINPSEDKRT